MPNYNSRKYKDRHTIICEMLFANSLALFQLSFSLEIVFSEPFGVEELAGVGGFGLDASLREEDGAVNPGEEVEAVLDHKDGTGGVLLGEASDTLNDVLRGLRREPRRRLIQKE